MTSREILLANAGMCQGVNGDLAGYLFSWALKRGTFWKKVCSGCAKGEALEARGQIPDKEKPAMGSAGLKVFTRDGLK